MDKSFVGFYLGAWENSIKGNVICFDSQSKQITAQGVSFIPTKLSQFTNDSNFVSSSTLESYIDKASNQTITGKKAFNEVELNTAYINYLEVNGNTVFYGDEVAVTNQLSVEKLVIGDCVITPDRANGGVKFSQGIASDSYISAKGTNPADFVQFGIWYQDVWYERIGFGDGIEVGNVSDISVSVNGNIMTISGEAIKGIYPTNVECQLVGFDDSVPSDVRLAPYAVSGNKLMCRIFAQGSIANGTGFKIKIYK